MTIGSGRSKDADAWRGWGLPVEDDHKAQATLKRLVPHHGGIQRQRRFIVHGAKIRATAHGLEVDLAVIFAPCPTALRVQTRGEKPPVRVAPQLRNRVPLKADDLIKICLLRRVAVHAMRAKARWQALPRRA